MSKKRVGIVLVTLVALCSLALNGVLIMRGGYIDKVLFKLGIKESITETNWTLVSWERSLKQLDYDADIVFFGDSITSNGDFQNHFAYQRIVNLGVSGDSLTGMRNRVEMLASVKPEKVFIMGGINSLSDKNSEKIFQQYEALIDEIQAMLPEAQLYIESILPISKEKEKNCADNTVIASFNEKLQELATEKDLTYIDLYSLYVLDGYMNPKLTKDGFHLQPDAYEYWFDAIETYVNE